MPDDDELLEEDDKRPEEPRPLLANLNPSNLFAYIFKALAKRTAFLANEN